MRKLIKNMVLWVNVFFGFLLLGAYISNDISPEFLWHFAFFGLFYPFLLLINLGFVVFWIWRSKWYFLISLGLILFGWTHIGKYMQLSGKVVNPEQEDLKVMSYNVRLFNHYLWDDRPAVRDSILTFMASEDPGIICFQEYVTVTNREADSEVHTDEVLHAYPNKHIFYTYKTNVYSNYGLATYSKYPIVRKQSIRFTSSYNSCIVTDVAIGTDTLRVFNVHLQSIKLKKQNYQTIDSLNFNSTQLGEVRDISDRLRLAYIKRARQVDELDSHIRRSPYPVLVCGDFNDTPVSYTYHTIRGDLKDAFRNAGQGFGNTYRGKLPSFRIDYIFHSPEFESAQYHTHRIDYSDHYPVSCVLQKK